MSSLSFAGGTVYLQQNGSDVEYSSDQVSWSVISFPCTITNISSGSSTLIIQLTTNLTLTTTSDYFICGSMDIQFGSTSLNAQGFRYGINIDSVTNYPGFIQNGTSSSNGYSLVHVYNLTLSSSGSTLAVGGGWIGQAYYSRGAAVNYIVNCVTNGDISQTSGGIVGIYAGANGGGDLKIIGCSSSGSIGDYGGGITGQYVGQNNGLTTVKSCYSTGAIGDYAGGICGYRAGDDGDVLVENCYSTGSIGSFAGGICGADTGIDAAQILISNCYSTGNIGYYGGGIFGSGSDSGFLRNCYSIGDITTDGGGILGPTTNSSLLLNCYTVGNVTGGQGYFVGSSATIPFGCFSEANSGTPGTWSDTHANQTLTGTPNPTVGATWVKTGVNQPYELYEMGFTPYSLTIITVSGEISSLLRNFAETVTVGETSSDAIQADASGNAFAIMQITGGDSSSYPTITMSQQRGSITTTSQTVPGTYTVYVRSVGSYHYTTFTITVLAAPSTTNAEACCAIPLNLQKVNYEQRNQIIAGNTLIGGVRNGIFPSYRDYYQMKMAYAAKRL